jgi:hypothetical protein
MAKIPLGSVERYSITMNPIGISNLRDTRWYVKVRARQEITIDKKNAIFIDKDTYDIFVDTNLIGKGEIKMRLYIDIIDSDYDKGLRPQVVDYTTGDSVV